MEKECKHCHKTFNVQRIDSIYCSRSCRQMAYVARKATNLKELNPTSVSTLQVETQIAEIKTTEPTTDKIPVLIREKIYEEHQSGFLKAIREQNENDTDLYAMHTCIITNQDVHSYWVGLRLRCLVECLLLFSEAKFTRVVDLMEICNAFTKIKRTVYFKNLPNIFPYTGAIENLGEKLKKICIKMQKLEQVKFKMETKDKIELILMRHILAQFIRREKFSQLEFE